MAQGTATRHDASSSVRFAVGKFRPPALPATLLARPGLLARLTAGADTRLTVVVGSAGAGKSTLLSEWAAARPPGLTAWMSCDSADADPVRFWNGFIEAPRSIAAGFGADAAELLAAQGVMSADVIASIANDAANLPAGSAIVVDDFHYATRAASDMTGLAERWPAETAQFVVSSRAEPPLRLHRLRVAGELCELRDAELYFSLSESRAFLAGFGVDVAPSDLVLLHERTEGWATALQMAALSLRGSGGPVRAARALEVRSHAIAEYFVAEVLDLQAPEVAQFMLEVSMLAELTPGACAAVTGRQDSAALLRGINAANLFVVALDDERTAFRYHRLVRQVLHAELRARDRHREQALHLRAAEWFETAGDTWRAAHHFFAARLADRALGLMQDLVVTDFLRDPALPAPLDTSMVDPASLVDEPGRLLAMAADLLIRGDIARGGQYLDLLEEGQQPIPPQSRLAARLATMRGYQYGLTGRFGEAVEQALAARASYERSPRPDEWAVAVSLILLRVYTATGDLQALDREAATALAMPLLTEPVRLVMVPGARALAWFDAGRLSASADAARAAESDARRLGFSQHFFAVDYLRALGGLALERRDLPAAERFTGQALAIAEQRRPALEFLVLLDRAQVAAAHGQVREALATVTAARALLDGTGSVLLARADELEALLRLSLGDLRSPAELASGLPPARRGLLLARVALAAGQHEAALEHLRPVPHGDPTPRLALKHQLLLAAAAIERGDPAAAGVLGGALHTARHQGFLNTVVTTAAQVTAYLIEHSAQLLPDPYIKQLIAAALEVHARQPGGPRLRGEPTETLTAAELRILKLLPTSTYLQMANTLYISRNTVKTHLRSIYQKLGATSRSQALERAVDLRLL